MKKNDIEPASPDKPKDATTDWGRDFVHIRLHDLGNVISDTAGLSRPTGNSDYARRKAESVALSSGKPVLVYQLAGVWETRMVEEPDTIRVGGRYATRNGLYIRIVYRLPGKTKWPFLGIAVDAEGNLHECPEIGSQLIAFTEDGRFLDAEHDRDLDLICTRRVLKFGFWPAVRTEAQA